MHNTNHTQDWECAGLACNHEISEKHYILTDSDLNNLLTTVRKEERERVIDFIEDQNWSDPEGIIMSILGRARSLPDTVEEV